MLVSLMTRLNSVSQMHAAQWNIMQNNASLMNICRSMPTFTGGERNLEMLAQVDKQYAMNKIQNETMYKLAAAQEEAAAQSLNQEFKSNKISYIA